MKDIDRFLMAREEFTFKGSCNKMILHIDCVAQIVRADVSLKRVSLLVTFMSHHPCWSFPSILPRDALHPALLEQRDSLRDTVHRQPHHPLPEQIPHEPSTRTAICKSENYAAEPLRAHSDEEYECAGTQQPKQITGYEPKRFTTEEIAEDYTRPETSVEDDFYQLYDVQRQNW